jgi:hypothetical protein
MKDEIWNTASLKEHIETQLDAIKKDLCNENTSIRNQIQEGDRRYSERFIGQEKAVDAALASAKEAVIKSEIASEKRFESVNEFRQTLTDQTATFMPRAEVEARIAASVEKINLLTDRLTSVESVKRGGDLTFAKVATLVAVVGGILSIIILLANNVIK